MEQVAVSEVQFSFFEGEDGSVRRTHSVAERLRNGILHPFSAAEIPVEMVNLARLIIFLSLLGVIPAGLIFLIDISVHSVTLLREKVSVTDTGGLLGFLIYLSSGVLLCLMSTLICRVVSTEAEGSGIPQMKAIMSGFYDKCKPALSLWAMVAKAFGLICAIGGGLPVGWEGPNVHISCIVAHHLSRLPFFKVLRKDRALRLQIMASACSVGLASSFGTPIGGVLYALETTSSFYLVPTFWKSVLATIIGALFYDVLYKSPVVLALENTEFSEDDYQRSQLVAFAILGCVMGLAGAFFVKCVHFVYNIRKLNTYGTNRYVMVGTIAFFSALVSYNTLLFRLDPRSAINELFSSNALQSLSWVDLLLLCLIKFPLVVISIGLPIPAGVFIPCFLLGSAMGRLYGEVLKTIFGAAIVPGGYAVVGAAAFTAGVTRALSCAVVILEVTGQLQHMVPALVAVLLAVIVGNAFTRGLYDTLIIMKDLPYMPHMRRDLSPEMKVRQIMVRKLIFVPETCTVRDAEEILRGEGRLFDSFPVLAKTGGLLGSVRSTTLNYLLERAKFAEKRITAPETNNNLEDRVINVDELQVGTIDVTSPVQSPNADSSVSTEDDDQVRSESAAVEEGEETESENLTRLFKVEPDLSPLTVTENMSLSQLHFMFVMLMPTHAFVESRGRLLGVVRRKDIIFTGKYD